MQGIGDGIDLKIPMSVRILTFVIMIAGYSAIFLFVPERALILSLIFWTIMQFRGLLYSPNITVYENGIEANRLGIKHFTHWRDISHVRIGEINSQIHPRGINKIVKTLLYSNLLINKWRHNYDESMEIIEQNVQASQEKFPERAYE
mgnify:CR=1 FL=1